MANVGTLTADLIARTKKFEAGMQRGNQSLKKISKSAKRTQQSVAALSAGLRRLMGAAVAMAGVGGFASVTKSAIEFGSSQSDIAGQLKINTVAFQAYTGAMKDAGGTQESMKKSIVSMQQAIVQGDEGMTTFTRAFDRLGINVKELRALKPETQFERIASAVANATDEQGAFVAVSEIFGKRNAPQLIEVMERLSKDGFGKLAEDIRKTYGIMDEETQRRLDMASDRIEQFKQKATISVGELIAGEGDFAALKILSAKLLGATARFSVGLLEGAIKLSMSIPTLIGGALEGVANKFGFSFEAIAIKFRILMKEAANAVILKLNEVAGTSVGIFSLGGRDGEYRKLAEVQARVARGGDGVLETALSKVEKLWASSPLQFWKDDIAAGTAAITEAYQADLDNAREAAKIRKNSLDELMGAATAANGVAAPVASVAGLGASGAVGLSGEDGNNKSSWAPYVAAIRAGITPASGKYDSFIKNFQSTQGLQSAAPGVVEKAGAGSASGSGSATIIELLTEIRNEFVGT